jgi:hypothetical protein
MYKYKLIFFYRIIKTTRNKTKSSHYFLVTKKIRYDVYHTLCKALLKNQIKHQDILVYVFMLLDTTEGRIEFLSFYEFCKELQGKIYSGKYREKHCVLLWSHLKSLVSFMDYLHKENMCNSLPHEYVFPDPPVSK